MPKLGWLAPDRKPLKLNVPCTESLVVRLQSAADKRGLKKTEMARRLLSEGLDKLEGSPSPR